MMTEIYRQYFQKSFTFLYPILGFSKSKNPKPLKTYMFWQGAPDEQYMLYCLYKREDTEQWKAFERDKLITHSMLHECVELDDDTIMYVFDLSVYGHDFENVFLGKYSRLSQDVKSKITDYYGVHTPEWVYVESYIFPDKYFKTYAAILEADIEVLKEVGELCPPCDMLKETCTLDIPEQV